MLKNQKNVIHSKIADFSLIWSMQLLAHIKQPPYIPFFEVATYGLVAEYFGVTEKRIKNAYTANRGLFENDVENISGNNILTCALKIDNQGKHFGWLVTFKNGVKAQIAYSANMVFNGRALLQFAILLQDESNVANQISNMLWKLIYDRCDDYKRFNKHSVKPIKAWFLYDAPKTEDTKPVSAVASAEKSPTEICPYLAAMAANDKPKDKAPVKMRDMAIQKPNDSYEKNPSHFGRTPRKCNQLDEDGNIIHIWESVAEAANVLGLEKVNVYKCCKGLIKSTGGEHGRGYAGKYRFTYSD